MVTVLYVEDDLNQAKLLPLLMRPFGIEVKSATSVEVALQMLAEARTDLVLVDGELGDRRYDGGGLSGQFIRANLIGKIPFARVTGAPGNIPEGLHGVFVAPKPYRVEDLAASLSAWVLERAAAA